MRNGKQDKDESTEVVGTPPCYLNLPSNAQLERASLMDGWMAYADGAGPHERIPSCRLN